MDIRTAARFISSPQGTLSLLGDSQRTLGSLGFVGTLCQLSQLTKCRRLQSVLFTLYLISPGSHIYPGTRRDIAALVAVGEVWWVSLLSFHQRSLYSVRYWWSKGRQRGFISSQARCFGAAGTW